MNGCGAPMDGAALHTERTMRGLMNPGTSTAPPPRAARLFRSVVVSSGLLLTGCGSAVVSPRASEPVAPDDVAPPLDAPIVVDAPAPPDAPTPPPDLPVVTDAMPVVDAQALVDAALEDARSQEIGWPTTKGVFCWGDDAGVIACCRHLDEPGTFAHCCVPVAGGCAPCEADDAGRCHRTDAALESRP
jgi:hypothetical protein